MSEQVGNRKISGLMSYLDSLVEKGRARSSVVTPLKTAIRQIFETVEKDNWENIDISTINLDDYIARFKNLALDRYNADSYNTYKARANRAITWYTNFLQNPGWTPTLRKSPISTNSKTTKKDVTPQNNPLSSPNSLQTISTPPKAELISYPFPMSNGTLASLYLPKNISQEDATRLSKFILTLVVGGDEDVQS